MNSRNHVKIQKTVIFRKSYSFHNGFNYDYRFIIKKLAEEFENNLFVQENTMENT